MPPEMMAGRLGAALLLGACIGLDREWRRKPAGLRTHMLIALASCTFTVLATELYLEALEANPDASADPLRIIEAVTAAAAFLGAGCIIQSRGEVSGMTTGAGIWLAAAVGLACGAGFVWLAAVNVALAIVILSVLGWVQGRLERRAAGGDPSPERPRA
ncbi:MAG: MgtC/SapB family protein [Alphaproteobacteria bacterium]|nr:MgtC/SapB family protein [Alphaproteobacteria bacterium]